MLKISDETILMKPQLEEESMEEIQIIKEAKKTEKNKWDEKTDKNIAGLLHKKDLRKNLSKTLINSDFTDEHIRLLKALNLSDEDIDNLRDLRRIKIEVSESSGSINSATSNNSSLNERMHLLPNRVYLRKVLSKPLIQALREIVMKKPSDPVEYLGHWLLHFKIYKN
nr:PREDICTED: uncharacterized protein LOC105678716 [Linepithema humile]